MESAGEDDSDEEREQDEGQNTQRTKRAPVRRAGKKRGERLPITEEDLRVMARYMFERGWSVSGPKRRWIEFAERPEVSSWGSPFSGSRGAAQYLFVDVVGYGLS